MTDEEFAAGIDAILMTGVKGHLMHRALDLWWTRYAMELPEESLVRAATAKWMTAIEGDHRTDADKDLAVDIAHALGLSAEQFTSGAADILVQHLRDHRLAAERETREACARIAMEQALVDEQMRNAARKEKDGHGALIHSAEAAAARSIAAAIRNTENTDDQ